MGKECVFPFEYKDITYHGCSPDGHVNIWCPTQGGVVDGKTDGPTKGKGGKWGECSWSPQCIGLDSPCRTQDKSDSGKPGKSCIFPFKYAFREFKTCTWVRVAVTQGLWCATEVDEDGSMKDWANCEKTDYCSSFWKTTGWAGIPEDVIWRLGNQAQTHLDTLKEKGNNVKNGVTGFFGSIRNFFKWLGCRMRFWDSKRDCSGEEDAASQGTVVDSIAGKSEVFRGHLVHPGPRWGWAVASSAGLGFGFLMAAAFAVNRGLRISSLQALRISLPPRRAAGGADDSCEQSLLNE